MGLSVDEIEGLEPAELVAAIAEETSHALGQLQPAARPSALQGLPRVAQVVFLTSELEAEVMIGSFVAYFANATGAQATLAAQAFLDIGAGALAAVVDEAVAAQAPHANAWVKLLAAQQESAAPPDTVEIHVPLPGEDALVALSDRFQSVADGLAPQWGELLEKFVDARRDELLAWAASLRD